MIKCDCDERIKVVEAEFKSFENVGELELFVDSQRQKYKIILGKDGIVINAAIAYVVESCNLVVGLLTDGILRPECKIINDCVYFGFNREAVCIKNGMVIAKTGELSEFYEFISDTADKGVVIAIFELDVVCFNVGGGILWVKSFDEILSKWELVDERLCIITEEDNPYYFNLIC